MRCLSCSTENPPSNKYCGSCGEPLAIPCRRCGHANAAAARFCGACGAALADGAAPEPAFVFRGERKHATVLFADVVGSTRLIIGLDPEQALERLRPAVAEMCAAVERYDGTVVRTLGDGIMAVFGAPQAKEGHALLACEAALAMLEAVSRGNGPTIRIGLHSGEIVSGILELDPVREPSAHGVTVHLASRLEHLAAPQSICMTEACYRLVRPFCDARPLGARPIDGFPEPVEIYCLLGLKPAVASQQFRGAQLTSFRGREAEFALLQQSFAGIDSGETRIIGISAPPGTGKSRLCYEFAEWCRRRLVPVLEARALIHGHATPLRPVLELLRSLFGISALDGEAVARQRIAEVLLPLDRDFEADLPLLADFLGVPDRQSPAPPLTPKARQARLLDVFRRIIARAGAASSVIIVEDLHWLDEASADFISALAESVVGTRTMLVVNYRPPYAAAWMRTTPFREISLEELQPADTGALVEELIGARPELADIRARVAERSHGNPFFAEELVRSLVDDCVLIGEPGNYAVGMNVTGGSLPATVQAVIGARVDRLPPAEKAVLQMAAIIGKEFPLLVLEEVAGTTAAELAGLLGRLCEAGLLQEQVGGERRSFAFRHPLIQEVAYASQLKSRRSTLHAAVAAAIERFEKDRLDELAGLLAYHFEAAGRFHEAASYGARAARWVGTSNPGQAVKHWRKVRALLQSQPRAPATDTLRILASGQIALFGWREGMSGEEARGFIDEAIGWARETDNAMIQMLLCTDGRMIAACGGSADLYVARIKEALASAAELPRGRAATLNAFLSHASMLAGLLEQALAANAATLENAAHVERFDREFLGFDVGDWARSLRGRILVRLGRLAEAEQWLSDVLQSTRAPLDPAVQFIPHLTLVDLAWWRGDAALAAQHAARVDEIAARSGIPYLVVYAAACRGTAKTLQHDLAGAADDFAEGIALARKAKAALEFEPEMLASLADCQLAAGSPKEALATVQEAISIARQRGARMAECRAAITGGAAAVAVGRAAALENADAFFERAAELIRISGARIYAPLLERERASIGKLVG
jgi:adenylate cyclase